MRVVIKIGGSTLFQNGSLHFPTINKYVSVIKQLLKDNVKVSVVVGGGQPARDYITVAQKMGLTMSYQDWLGIEAARQNARLLLGPFQGAYPQPPTSYEELQRALRTNDLVFVGGLQPGQSTNAVAALTAENLGADYLFNCSNVDYVYDQDPNLHKDAKKLESITYSKFIEVISKNEQTPGAYALFDVVAAQIIQRSKIRLSFVNGSDPENILRVLKGEKLGTMVHE